MSRPEDLERIARLEEVLQSREEALRTVEERMALLRNELLLREDNYNKHFRNGGLGERVLDVASAQGSQQGLKDWMLKSKRRSTNESGRRPV